MKYTIILLSVLILTSGCRSFWIVYSADGHVVDAHTHQPIPHAKVTRICDRAPAKTQTDANGHFKFHGERIFQLPIGDTPAAYACYRVDVDGYESWENCTNQEYIFAGWAGSKDYRHHLGEIELTPLNSIFAPDYHALGLEDAIDAKIRFHSYKQVFTARILEDHWEDRGAHKYALHHFKAIVTQSFKGGWKAGERIAFFHGVDFRAPIATSNVSAGITMLVLTDEHANREIILDTGDFLIVDTNLQQVLETVFTDAK